MRRSKHHPGSGDSAAEVDLSAAQLEAFKSYAKQLEDYYGAFSVSLDDAISLHESGKLTQSFEAIALTLPMCDRLIESLENMLRSIAEHSKVHGTMPAVSLLSPEDFHGEWGKRSAVVSQAWSQALLSQESQFRNKISTLESVVEYLGRDFRVAADALASLGISVDSLDLWAAMDSAHFDLNTCLRESIVSLKCFLKVLPTEELREFQEAIANDPEPHARVKAKGATAGRGPKPN